MYQVVATVTGLAVDAFYRRVSLQRDDVAPDVPPHGGATTSGPTVPPRGPVLLIANHPNGLIDPIVVANVAGRQIRMLAKAPLFEMPVISLLVKAAGALPVYRAKDGADTTKNEATFRAVTLALLDGSCVLIFPEGISHDEPQLQKLKTGAARMALAACEAGARELVVVPVGLTYRDKERFRSAVATLVGAPLAVAPFAERAAAAGADVDDRELVQQLTDAMREALEKVTLNLERWEDLPLLEAVDAIWRIDDPDRARRLLTLNEGVALLRAQAPKRLAEARAHVVEWSTRLEMLGLSPRDLSPEHSARRADPGRAAGFALKSLATAAIGLPVATFGALFFAAPFWTTHAIYLAARPSRDVAATVKVLASLVLFPLWHVVATALLWRFVSPMTAVLVAALSPLAGMTTRWFFRGRQRALRDLLAMARLLFSRRLQRQLEGERDALIAELDLLGKLVEQLREVPASSTSPRV